MTEPRETIRKTLPRNIVASVTRVAVNAMVAVVLPAFLTHRLPVAVYGTWVLILQLSAYVSFLDFGVQTAVAKFVAEYEAVGDDLGAGRRASAGFAIVAVAGGIGLALTLLLAWQVPRLFQAMPASLFGEARQSVLWIGASLCFQLGCSVFSAVFIGLQRYRVPMALAVLNRLLFSAAVVSAALLHGGLATMAVAGALANILTGASQVVAWKRLASRVRISLGLIDKAVLKEVLRYCLVLGVWSGATLCISGLDVTIVGHFDFGNAGFYSVAAMPTNLLLMLLSSALAPLLPAASAASATRGPDEMGRLLLVATRYSNTVLLLLGAALLVFGYPTLRAWVGEEYARQCLPFLRVLVLANLLRNLCLPYATMVLAVGRQWVATASPVSEAVVNLASSIYFAKHFGAMGVALGTLLGAGVGVTMHFVFSMRYTADVLAVGRGKLLIGAVLRPALIALPSGALFLVWPPPGRQLPGLPIVIAWGLATLAGAWFLGLDRGERKRILGMLFVTRPDAAAWD